MNKEEARALLAEQLDRMAEASYAALAARVGDNDVREVTGASGARYQIEVQILWDSMPRGAVRLLGGIDDGGLSAFVPLADSRLVVPPRARALGEAFLPRNTLSGRV
jgi:hypothetical protein